MKTPCLVDETLREGDARGYHPHRAEDRLKLIQRIHQVTGIERFCLGMAVTSRVDYETLVLAVRAVEDGGLPAGLRLHVFSALEIAGPTRDFLASLTDAQRRHVVIDFATTATAPGHRHVPEPWLFHLDPKTGALRDPGPEGSDGERLAHRARRLGEEVARLRELGQDTVGVIIQDAFRCPIAELAALVEGARAGGVHAIRLHDTVGVATPAGGAQRISELVRRFPDTAFFVHFHNDFGLATASTLAALAAGAAGADVCTTGLGNRAGNARTAEVLMGLKHLYDVELPNVRYDGLSELARDVERHFCLADSPVTPITGRLLHLDEASIRTHAMEVGYLDFFLPYAPATVGGRLEAAHSDTSGRQAVALAFQRHAAALAAREVAIDDALVDRGLGWLARQRAARAAGVAEVWAHHERYLAALRASYVTDEELVEACLASRGGFDDPTRR